MPPGSGPSTGKNDPESIGLGGCVGASRSTSASSACWAVALDPWACSHVRSSIAKSYAVW